MLKNQLIAKLNNKTVKKKNNLKRKLKPVDKCDYLKPTKQLKTHYFSEEILNFGKQFLVDPNTVEKAIQGVIKCTLEKLKLKKKLFDDEQIPLFIQLNSVKVPTGYSKILRIPLKHSLLNEDSEVCLLVAEVKGIPNKNHEEHLQHYEKLLREKGVTNIKKIMTFHEFRTEYETFELKRRFVELYDVFLVDGKISGKVVAKCGKIFYKKRKVPTAVKLQATKLRDHIDKTLKKTPLYLHCKGDSFTVQFGHSNMCSRDLVENVFSVLNGVEKSFPGGFANIRNLNIFTFKGLSIPIYTTLKNQNEVDLSKNVTEEDPVADEI